MKRIGIEGSPFFGSPTGIGQYARRLITAASKLGSDTHFEIIRHWLPFKELRPPIAPNQRLSYRLVKWFPPAVYFQTFKRLGWFLPYDAIALRRYDAMLFFNFVVFPVRKKVKTIAFIHDLSFIHFSEYTQVKNLTYMQKFVPYSIDRASHIITISQSTKNQIVEHYKVSPGKISIITPAINHSQFYQRPMHEISEIRKKYKLPTKYILYASTLEPRKNIEGILRSYSALGDDLKMEYGLVLAGGKGWKDESIFKTIDELRSAGENIITTGYVPDEDLPAIYSGATLFVYPSFYEGFGIPLLEAMACGVPVITSNNTSLPEVVGSAAILVEAGDTTALSKAINKVLNNPERANLLREKGLAQAKKFSWEKSAKKLMAVLEKL
ncbi:MAG: glycosyltransferase family 1 protein [Candidatus Saccharimonadales bacterium]